MKALTTVTTILLALVTGSLAWRLNSTTNALARQEQQIRTLTAALAAKPNHEAPIVISAQTVPDNEIYTLYRSSPTGPELRVHVGTFDTRSFDEPAQNKAYNYEICSDAQLNFNERNKGKSIQFWCEEGRFREKLR
jgi:hypothetical protein